MLLYVVYRETTMCWAGDPKSTWPGWQIAKALEPAAVLQYLSYGGAAAAMICLEWWVSDGGSRDQDLGLQWSEGVSRQGGAAAGRPLLAPYTKRHLDCIGCRHLS